MEDRKRKSDAEASSSTNSKRPTPSDERESGSPLPDSPEKINEPSESEANSDPPASYADVIGNNYYVFLSFRGSDTRRGFVDHLYHELARVGLHHPNFVFRDDEKLRFGEPIAENLLSAIERSKVSIPVISKNYAASKWCLREIIQIMKCVKSGQQKVYPVLYKVTADDAKDKQGEFMKALHNPDNGFDEELKREGPVALEKALKYKVFESEKFAEGYEGKLVKALVETIMCEQKHDFPPSPPMHLVGFDDHVANVMNLVDTAPSEIRTIVIYGIGGVGKTTLATIIYRKLSNKYDGCPKKFTCSFLKDVRETIKSNGMEHVQSHLLSDIINGDSKVRNSDEGIGFIQFSCENKKVLILLDDVDSQAHLDKLIGGCNFMLGSRIIITCRDKALLKSEYEGYELKGLNPEDSLLLFNRYAFEGKQPPKELMAHSSNIVRITGGLPLTLRIVGSLLKGASINTWKEMLEKLKKMPHKDVQKMLRITYDSLEYEEQQMFLDIACLFTGIHKRIAIYLWKDILWCQHSGLDRLIELSLIEFDDDDKLIMHDHLRDLGRAIARPKYKKPWDSSRLWGEEAITVQRSKDENRNIEALCLDENGSYMFMERESFKRMPYLKFLHLSEVDFDKNFKDSLSELRWLKWEKCSDSFEATDVDLEKLLVLDLSYGYISDEWRGWSSIKMERLKVLNLSESYLQSTPNLSTFKSLEMLILENCRLLMEIDPSIGDLECLIHLNLRGCNYLEKLPEEMGKLKELEMLDASSCSLLDGLPDSINQLVNLSTLDLRYCCRICRLPKNIGSHVKLQRLLLDGVNDFLVFNGEEDGHILDSIGKLEGLTELDLSNTNMWKLPESIGDLKNLKILRILKIKNLRTLPSTIHQLGKLEEIHASACPRLGGKIHIDGLSSLRILRLRETHISGFHGAIDKLSCLEELDLYECRSFLSLPKLPTGLTSLEVTCENHTLPQLSHLIYLKTLIVSWCHSLKYIPELPSGLLVLKVGGCDLEELPSLSKLEFLRYLSLVNCHELTKIKGLEALKSLQVLEVVGCRKMSKLDGLEQLVSLQYLDIEISEPDAPLSNDDLDLDRLKSLERLSVSGYPSLRRPDISQLSNLKKLVIKDCRNLVEIKCVERLKNLKEMTIHSCPLIETVPDLSYFDNLTCFSSENCGKLHVRGPRPEESPTCVYRW